MGAQLDALKTSSGRVILAFQREGDRRQLMETYPANDRDAVDQKDLDRQLAAIRERGFEEADSQLVSGVRNISFPVLNFAGDAVAALAVPFLRHVGGGPADLVKARTALREAATKLSIAIGARSIDELAPRRAVRS
jgi:DNA-binding IclR family transcriptional regulator